LPPGSYFAFFHDEVNWELQVWQTNSARVKLNKTCLNSDFQFKGDFGIDLFQVTYKRKEEMH